jgi:hypothetical protein
MVRVDRLYLGPMFSPDKLGSDKIMPIVEIGSRTIACACESPLFEGLCLSGYRSCLPENIHNSKKNLKKSITKTGTATRKTRVDFHTEYQKMEEENTIPRTKIN